VFLCVRLNGGGSIASNLLGDLNGEVQMSGMKIMAMLAGAIVVSASSASAQAVHGIKRGTVKPREVWEWRSDRRDFGRDRADARRDLRDLRRDRADARHGPPLERRLDRIEVRHDQRELRLDKRELRQDRRELHVDRWRLKH